MNKIKESQWIEVCGYLSVCREHVKKSLEIESMFNEKFPFLQGYFSDETYDDLNFQQIRKKWSDNNFIDMKIVKDKKTKSDSQAKGDDKE